MPTIMIETLSSMSQKIRRALIPAKYQFIFPLIQREVGDSATATQPTTSGL
jgi:hypothetical protein